MMNSRFFVWIKAARLPSQSYILIPILLGQMVAFSIYKYFSWDLFLFLLAFSLFIQFYIIFANDYADFETDRINKTYTMFSGGSRVLVDGELSLSAIKMAIIIAMTLCLVLGFIFTFIFQRHLSLAFVILSFSLLWAYSYKPLQLSYRGGGELLQTLGLGLILPYFGFYIQSNSLIGLPSLLLCILFPTHLACAIATSLPDQPSDKLSAKKTFTVRFGSDFAKATILVLQIISLVLLWSYFQIGFQNLKMEFLVYLPIIGILLSLPFFRSNPGETKLSFFVFFSLLTTMATEIVLILIHYFG